MKRHYLLAWLVLLSPPAFTDSARGDDLSYQRLDPTRPGLRLRLNFPADATVDPNRLMYRLGARADLEVDVQTVMGSDAIRPPQRVHVAAVIDGKQVPIQVDGRRPTSEYAFSIDRTEEVQHFVVRIDGHAISAGAHSASLLLWREGGGSFPSPSFTIVKGNATFSPRSVSGNLGSQTPTGRPTMEMKVPRGALLRGEMPGIAPDERGRLFVDVAFERAEAPSAGDEDDRAARPYALLCLANGRQVKLGDIGHSLHLRLQPGERIGGTLEIDGLRAASRGKNQLACFVLPADGEPLTDSEGSPSARYEPVREIGSLVW